MGNYILVWPFVYKNQKVFQKCLLNKENLDNKQSYVFQPENA